MASSRQRGKSSSKSHGSSSPTVSQRSIIGELLVIFKAKPVIDKRDFYEEYSNFFKGKDRKDYLQDHGFTGISNMLKVLDIFEYQGKAKLKFSLCHKKLLDLLLNQEIYAHLPSDEKARVFLQRNGFESKDLCHYFNVSCLEDLSSDSLPSSSGIVYPSVSRPSSVPQPPLLPQHTLPSPLSHPSLPHRYPSLLPPPNPSLFPPPKFPGPPSNPTPFSPRSPTPLPPQNPPPYPPPYPSSSPFLPRHSPSVSYHSVPPPMVYANNPLLPAASNPSFLQARSAYKRPAMYESDRTVGDDDSSPPASKKGSTCISDDKQSSTCDDVKSVDNIQGTCKFKI